MWIAAVAAALALTGRPGVLAMAGATPAYLLMRAAFLQRLGGVTGDCVGAMIEVIETSALVGLCS